MIYRLLLHAFPREFRRAFGDDMHALFAERCKDERHAGVLSYAAFWLRTIIDITQHGLAERRHLAVRQGDGFMTHLFHDARFALRLFARRRMFTAAAIATLALGIGVNIAMFSVVNAVLIRRLPFPSPSQLVRLGESEITETRIGAFNPGNYVDVRSMTIDTFTAVGGYKNPYPVILTGTGSAAVPARTALVRPEFFDVLGTAPAMGRPLTDADTDISSRSIVIAGEFWRAKLGADPNVIGRAIELDGQPWTVVGVMPDGAVFPMKVEIWKPLRFTPNDISQRGSWSLQVIARLRDGKSIADGNAAVQRAMTIIGANSPGPMPRTAHVTGASEELTQFVRKDLLFAQGISLAILLIACANLANLMLASATERQQEFTVRASMGAGRARLIRQLLTESFVLSVAGSILGFALAALLVPSLLAAYPGTLPRVETIGVRWTEFAAALAAAFVTTAAFGLLPALIASRARAGGSLSSSVRVGSTRAANWLRSGLVIAEVVMTLSLLAGSFLLIRSFGALTSQHVGFSAENVSTTYLQIPSSRFPSEAEQRRVFADARELLKQQPDVDTVATTFPLPFDLASMGTSMRWDPALDMGTFSSTRRYVSSEYLDALSIPLKRGRFFSEADTDNAPLVAVVNESFAAKYGKTRDVVGLRYVGKNNALVTIIGVVADIRTTYVRFAESELILPLSQNAMTLGSFIIKSRTPVSVIDAHFRDVMRARYPYLPTESVQPLTSVIGASVAQQRFNMSLLTALAALALALSAVGIYGVMAYVVSQRQREMAIRLALGAQPAHVRSLSIRQGLMPVLIGIAGGLAGAWFLTTMLKKELFQIQPHDPWTLAFASVTFFLVGLIACWLPARRTARVDAFRVLKQD